MYINGKQILVFSFVFDLSWAGIGSSLGSVAYLGCRELPDSEQHGSRQLQLWSVNLTTSSFAFLCSLQTSLLHYRKATFRKIHHRLQNTVQRYRHFVKQQSPYCSSWLLRFGLKSLGHKRNSKWILRGENPGGRDAFCD